MRDRNDADDEHNINDLAGRDNGARAVFVLFLLAARRRR